MGAGGVKNFSMWICDGAPSTARSSFFLSTDFFSKFNLEIKNNSGIPSLDPDQAQHFVKPYLGPNCLQRLSADDTSRQRLNFCEKTNILLIYSQYILNYWKKCSQWPSISLPTSIVC